MFIVSRCLLGVNCKYNGGNNHCADVVKFIQDYAYVDVCPECAGGLPIPRVPSEIATIEGKERVVSQTGEDVTDAFIRGAERMLNRAVDVAEDAGEPLEGAILKAKSPSCGVGQVYNGQFDGTLVDGNGIFTRLLLERGIPVYTEKNLPERRKKQNTPTKTGNSIHE